MNKKKFLRHFCIVRNLPLQSNSNKSHFRVCQQIRVADTTGDIYRNDDEHKFTSFSLLNIVKCDFI
jgi:hypothetical protein